MPTVAQCACGFCRHFPASTVLSRVRKWIAKMTAKAQSNKMGKILQTREYHLWAVARPSPDVEGQWVGHCLQLDVVTVGDSLEHCFHMLREASAMVVCDDLNLGRDPLARADHADPVWKEWARVMDRGTVKSISKTKNQASFLWALRWSVTAALTELPMPHTISRDRKNRTGPSICTSEVELVLAA